MRWHHATKGPHLGNNRGIYAVSDNDGIGILILLASGSGNEARSNDLFLIMGGIITVVVALAAVGAFSSRLKKT